MNVSLGSYKKLVHIVVVILSSSIFTFAPYLVSQDIPLTPEMLTSKIKNEDINLDKKFKALKIFSENKMKMSPQCAKDVKSFLLSLITCENENNANTAFELFKTLNVTLSNEDVSRLLDELTAKNVPACGIANSYYLFFTNGFYTPEFRAKLIDIVKNSKNLTLISTLLPLVGDYPYNPENIGKLKDSKNTPLNFENYDDREEFFRNLANHEYTSYPTKLMNFTDDYNQMALNIVMNNFDLIVTLLSSDKDFLSECLTNFSTIDYQNNLSNDNAMENISKLGSLLDTVRNKGDNCLFSFLSLVRDNVFILPYYSRGHYDFLIKSTENENIKAVAAEILNKCLFMKKDLVGWSSYFKDHNRHSFEKAAYDVLTDKTKTLREREYAYWLLSSYNCFFSDIELPKNYIATMFAIVKDNSDNPSIRTDTLHLLSIFSKLRKEDHHEIAKHVEILKNNIKKYKDVKETFDKLKWE